jgi:23S rRNA maturation mini-RNase III
VSMLVVADVKKITSRSAQGNNRRKHAHVSIMCMRMPPEKNSKNYKRGRNADCEQRGRNTDAS